MAFVEDRRATGLHAGEMEGLFRIVVTPVDAYHTIVKDD